MKNQLNFNGENIVINSLKVYCDYETSSRCGAEGYFQIETLIANTDDGELDITNIADQETHYSSLNQILEDLGINVDIEDF